MPTSRQRGELNNHLIIRILYRVLCESANERPPTTKPTTHRLAESTVLLMHRLITVLIALVWLANGLLCKLLMLVPRHAVIVARILGPEYATPLTRLIGLGEIGMAAWVLSGIKARWCATAQITLVLSMNTLEAILAPDLLLWGRANAIFAALFCLLIYGHTFKSAHPTSPH
jgi:hypothetical protein